jgi:hypothetical protein
MESAAAGEIKEKKAEEPASHTKAEERVSRDFCSFRCIALKKKTGRCIGNVQLA